MIYGVHVCATCLVQAHSDADGNPQYECDCNGGNRDLPVYIEVDVPPLIARREVIRARRSAEAVGGQ